MPEGPRSFGQFGWRPRNHILWFHRHFSRLSDTHRISLCSLAHKLLRGFYSQCIADSRLQRLRRAHHTWDFSPGHRRKLKECWLAWNWITEMLQRRQPDLEQPSLVPRSRSTWYWHPSPLIEWNEWIQDWRDNVQIHSSQDEKKFKQCRTLLSGHLVTKTIAELRVDKWPEDERELKEFMQSILVHTVSR